MMDWRLFEEAAAGNVDFLKRVEFCPSELERVTPQRNTVLHIAVKHKRNDFAAAVLFLCPSLLLRTNAKGDTPLHAAASVGCFEVSKLLVNLANRLTPCISSVDTRSQLLKAANKYHETALHVAVKNGHLDVSNFLVEEDPGLLDMADNGDATPLYLAVARGFSAIADHILEASLLASGRGPQSMNALHAALGSDIDPGVLRKMVQRRPEMIKEVDAIGWTPLHYSVWRGDVEVTQLFLEHDASAAYVPDKDGQCPLHLAAFTGHVEIFEELVRCCPYIWELLDSKGRTCLHLAVISGSKGIIDCVLKTRELLGLVNEQDDEGNTPLHLAVVHERYAIISRLSCNNYVDKHAENDNRFTAIDLFHSKKKEIRFQVAMVYYSLTRYYGRTYYQHYIETTLKKIMNGEAAERERTNEGRDSSMYEVHLVAAVFVATVTFNVALTMPGGYATDGPDKGRPILIHEPAFKWFVVFDTIAFSFSLATVYFLFYASRDGYRTRDYFLFAAALLLILSLLAMASAFVSGMYLVLSKSEGLAVVPFLMVAFFTLYAFGYWFVDPRGMYVPGLQCARSYFRKLLFRRLVLPYSA